MIAVTVVIKQLIFCNQLHVPSTAAVMQLYVNSCTYSMYIYMTLVDGYYTWGNTRSKYYFLIKTITCTRTSLL